MNVPINEILEKVAGGIGKFSDKVQPAVHSGRIQEFWDWVDEKWYHSELHNGVKDPRNIK
ncbi:MAG: hypothetical protein KBS43_06485 [Oscillospiraceae bacterium]|nr:hypothetical protein [Candidatus Limimonas coprohippi]MCQ2488448.1 hypothetical protein [Clostridia bacterium]